MNMMMMMMMKNRKVAQKFKPDGAHMHTDSTVVSSPQIIHNFIEEMKSKTHQPVMLGLFTKFLSSLGRSLKIN
jgi:hypothetical protein